MAGKSGEIFKKGRANLIAWRDACARKLLGVADTESLNVHNYNIIEPVEAKIDEYVANQIAKYIELMAPGKSFTEQIDVAGVFWDLSVAAICAKANKTIDALCMYKFEIHYDQIHGWQWFAEKSIRSNNAYAFSVIEKIISNQEPLKTHTNSNYDDLVWKSAAYDIKDLLLKNKKTSNIGIERDEGESDRSWGQANLSRLSDLFCLSLNVHDNKQLAVAQKRLNTFFEKNSEELKTMKDIITGSMTIEEIGSELFQEAIWSCDDEKILWRRNKSEILVHRAMLTFSVWCKIMNALTGMDNKKMLINFLADRSGANEYYNEMADIFSSVVEASVLKDTHGAKVKIAANKRSI
jgi:hypothetical protein